jgi:maltose-binding protein MalE
MGRLDAASEVKRLANQIPQGSEYDPIWTALSAAVDSIERGVKDDNSSGDG